MPCTTYTLTIKKSNEKMLFTSMSKLYEYLVKNDFNNYYMGKLYNILKKHKDEQIDINYSEATENTNKVKKMRAFLDANDYTDIEKKRILKVLYNITLSTNDYYKDYYTKHKI